MPLLDNYDRNNYTYIYICMFKHTNFIATYIHAYILMIYICIVTIDLSKALWLSAYISPGAWVPVAEGCTFIQ